MFKTRQGKVKRQHTLKLKKVLEPSEKDDFVKSIQKNAKSLRGKRTFLICDILINSGMRAEEICKLKVEDTPVVLRVPVEKSKAEIEHTLLRYGASEFAYGTSPRGAGIMFKHKNRVIKMNIPNPNRDDYSQNKVGENKYKQAQRQRWRILLLALKAKLELIDEGLSTFEDEFLAQTCLPGGKTISQLIQQQIDNAIETKGVPKLLLEGNYGSA